MKPFAEVTASDLPFLIEYGAWVWKVVLAILVIASVAITRRISRRFHRKATQRRVDEHIALAKRHGAVLLRGIVRTGQATTVAQETHWNSQRSPLVQIEADGQAFDLIGPVTVSYGSTQSTTFGLPQTDTPELVHGLASFLFTHVRSIREGDEVVVSGLPASTGAPNAAFRQLGAHPALVHAYVTATKPAMGSLLRGRWVVGAFALSMLWLMILVGIGSDIATRAKETKWDNPDIEDWRIQLAAALPGSRADALAEARSAVSGRSGERATRLAIAMDKLLGICPDETLARADRPVEALAAARSCAPERVAARLVRLGNFEEANQLLPVTDDLATVAAIGAGDWTKAAQITELIAQRSGSERGVRFKCAAALFKTYAGDPNAFASIEGRDKDTTCVLASILALPLDQRLSAFAARSDALDRDALEHWVAAGGKTKSGLYQGSGVQPWFSAQAISLHEGDPEQERSRHCEVTARDFVLDDVAAARRNIERCAPSYSAARAKLELALRHPELGISVPAEDARERDLDGNFLMCDSMLEGVDEDGRSRREQTAITLAGKGDGEQLARLLEKCSVNTSWLGMMDMAHVFAPIRTGRADVATALRWAHPINSFMGIDFPFDAAMNHAWLRDLARILGDDHEGDYQNTIAMNFARALLDPQKTTAFAFWNDL